MTWIRIAVAFFLSVLPTLAFSQETVISMEGAVPEGEETHFFLVNPSLEGCG